MKCMFFDRSLWVLAMVCLTACGKKEPPVEPTAAQALNEYAMKLVQAHPDRLASAGPPHVTVGHPLTYLTHFIAVDAGMFTVPLGNDPVGNKARNIGVAEHWNAMYCGPEVQAIMRRHHVAATMAEILSEAGERHSAALCVAEDNS